MDLLCTGVFDCTLWRLAALWTLNNGAKRRVYEEVAALSIWVAETKTCCLRLMPLTGERFSAIKLNCSCLASYLWRIGKLHLQTTKWTQRCNIYSPGVFLSALMKRALKKLPNWVHFKHHLMQRLIQVLEGSGSLSTAARIQVFFACGNCAHLVFTSRPAVCWQVWQLRKTVYKAKSSKLLKEERRVQMSVKCKKAWNCFCFSCEHIWRMVQLGASAVQSGKNTF